MRAAALLSSLLLVGCVQVGPKSLPEPKPCPKPEPVQCPKVAPTPPAYDMPGIPQVVNMRIKDDSILECDKGCEDMIRAYANGQAALRSKPLPSP